MARRSRKGTGSSNSIEVASTSARIWRCAIYARLSSKDNGHDGDSIQAQMDYVSDCLEGRDDICIVGYYSDNGRTGTTFKGRLEFDRLMDDVRAGVVDCIAVKDLSRFGRNAYETGTFLQKIFPFLGVRFIAVNDHFDTLEGDGGIMVPFKGLINELYAADTSRKVGAIKHRQAERGHISYGVTRYGYRVGREARALVPDEATSPFIPLIFGWANDGVRPDEIAKRLAAMGAPTPMEHRNAQAIRESSDYHADVPWKAHAVSRILDDVVYKGVLVTNRTHQSFAERIPNTKVPESERFVFLDAHPALIEPAVFDAVAEMRNRQKEELRMAKNATAKKRDAMPDIFSGKLFCAHCGGAMLLDRRFNKGERRGNLYYCRKHKRKGCPNTIRIPERLVRIIVADTLRAQVDTALAFERVLPRLAGDFRIEKARARRAAQLSREKAEVRRLESKQEHMYEQYALGTCDEKDYRAAKLATANLIREAKARMAQADANIVALEAMLDKDNSFAEAASAFEDLHTMTPDLLDALVSRVTIGVDGSIGIEFRYTDWIARADALGKVLS